MGKTPLILVSNDDGVQAEGLRLLSAALKELGHVVVVAPDSQQSAASQSITLHRPLRVKRLSEDVYAIDGTPTDCVMFAVHGILKAKPDLVVAGVNHGPNLGDDVHYSGTVAVAYEAGLMGIPSIAVSLVTTSATHFEPAVDFSVRIAKKVLAEGLPRGIILNVNVPDLPAEDLKGYTFTKQGKRSYGDIIVEKEDPRGRKYYWIGGDLNGYEDISGSDCNAVREGKISVTPLRVDITDHDVLNKILDWKV